MTPLYALVLSGDELNKPRAFADFDLVDRDIEHSTMLIELHLFLLFPHFITSIFFLSASLTSGSIFI